MQKHEEHLYTNAALLFKGDGKLVKNKKQKDILVLYKSLGQVKNSSMSQSKWKTWSHYGPCALLLNNSNASLLSPRCEAS